MNRTVRISVTDNDDPQGVLSFRNPRITVPENATSGNSRMVELEIQRTKGTFGAVSVLVRSVGGGEPWNPSLQSLKSAVQGKGGEKNATIGLDYVELSARVNFPVRISRNSILVASITKIHPSFRVNYVIAWFNKIRACNIHTLENDRILLHEYN